ncbi:MAG TPA: M13 family metallopeptidase [Brumimicrobium sp.]|nr:M13 family metallopeptidase [Brumimicrobium sp.]
MNKSILLVLGISLLSCGTSKKDKTDTAPKTPYTINTSYLDKSVSPTEDFYQFANGTWIANNPIPPSESRWGSFNELDKLNKAKLTEILNEALESRAESGNNLQIIGDYYGAMKNLKAREDYSLKKIEQIKYEIAQIKDREDIPSAIFSLRERGIGAFYSLYVGQDLKNVDKHVLYLSQGGLGMPNREYYMDNSKKEIQEEYKKYITTAFKIYGFEDAEKRAQLVFDFEVKLAETMMKPAELRVPENTYNPIKINEAESFSNFLDLKKYISLYGSEDITQIIVGQPMHFEKLIETIENQEFKNIQNYITWKIINHYAPYMGEELVQLNFDFYGTVLSGTKEMKPINERAIEEMTNMPIKTALAKEFVSRYFSEEAKEKVNTMVDNLLAVYEKRINNLDWMTDETKKEALKKLHSIGRKLGYPDKWKNLDKLTITSQDYLANIDACMRFSYNENMSKLSKPVNREEWGMPAHMVNAYYHPLLNEIAFPAGIMQAPFFDINAEDAVNYGGIGMVIGHEFTHGFDDMGSKFAADGSFTNWWSEEDRKNFEERTEKLGTTFSGFCPIEGHCVNPDLTMGENIADLGGITMAYYAYTMTDEFKKGEKREGFTPAQRFYLAYAQLWKINYTDAELKKRIATDPHSPGKYRVNGPLMNSPEFFEAFGVKEGDAMRKSEKEISKIW